MSLSNTDKSTLLNIARNSITDLLNQQQSIINSEELPQSIKNKNGVFVTLKIDDKLRGCIGYLMSDNPLYLTVQNAARESATHDPRFSSVSNEEIEQLEIEISVLSIPKEITSYDEIIIGTHGVVLDDLGKRALLLPQVPVEHKMDRDQFISALCEKAGLYHEYWKERQLSISIFTAEVFSEMEQGLK